MALRSLKSCSLCRPVHIPLSCLVLSPVSLGFAHLLIHLLHHVRSSRSPQFQILCQRPVFLVLVRLLYPRYTWASWWPLFLMWYEVLAQRQHCRSVLRAGACTSDGGCDQGFIQPPRRGGVLPPETNLLPPGEGPSTPPSGEEYLFCSCWSSACQSSSSLTCFVLCVHRPVTSS